MTHLPLSLLGRPRRAVWYGEAVRVAAAGLTFMVALVALAMVTVSAAGGPALIGLVLSLLAASLVYWRLRSKGPAVTGEVAVVRLARTLWVLVVLWLFVLGPALARPSGAVYVNGDVPCPPGSQDTYCSTK